jgi:hypothetical protein
MSRSPRLKRSPLRPARAVQSLIVCAGAVGGIEKRQRGEGPRETVPCPSAGADEQLRADRHGQGDQIAVEQPAQHRSRLGARLPQRRNPHRRVDGSHAPARRVRPRT